MKPNFALDLSHEGIVLTHRSARGRWTEVGDVKLDDPALRENLSFLRSTAVGLEGKGFGSKLILPNSQILYLNVTAPGPDEESRMSQILSELEGQTPYAVKDLTFDWIENGDSVQVAVVAKETLDEAEEFAVEHRFNPISFAGKSSDDPDAWLPFFGRTDYSYAILEDDVDVRDTPLPVFTAASAVAAGGLFDAQSSGHEDESVQAVEASDETNTDENMFAEEPLADQDNNIFSETEVVVAAEETIEATAPSFSSRRQSSDTSENADITSRIENVAPRFAIETAQSDDGPDDAPVEPETIPVPEIPQANDYDEDIVATPPVLIAEDELRAAFRDDETAQSEPEADSTGKLAILILSLKAFATKLKPLFSKLFVKSVALLSIAMAFALKAGAALFKKKPPKATNEIAAPVEEAAKTKPSRRKTILAGLAALLLLGLVGLGFAFFPSGNQESVDSGSTSATEIAFSTTSAERGVRANNRPRNRPSDMGAIITASIGGLEPELDLNIPIRAVRPARRSVFEDATDPDASLPDTATPVTNLTAEEQEDLRSLGLEVPTNEEIAEGGEGNPLEDMSLAEIAAAYEATGILQSLLPPPSPRSNELREDIYVASADRDLEANDAIILPDFSEGVADHPPARFLSPLSPDTKFVFNTDGFVVATAEGALNPDGILVRLGKPAVTPPKKPETTQLVPPSRVAALKPRARPAGLRTGEDAIFVQGRLTLAQLRTKKPKVRPESEQATTAEDDTSPSELAVLTSFQPAKRPSDFEKTVEKSRVRIASTRPATGTLTDSGVNNGPVLPTRANVAKTATIKNAINLSKINLIGVYGSASKRKALLRLPSGRLVRVKIGDRVNGGRVAAIGTTSLSYVKSGRNRVLKMPE